MRLSFYRGNLMYGKWGDGRHNIIFRDGKRFFAAEEAE